MGKTLIKIDCVDQRLIITSAPTVASGGKNEDEVEFNFCSKWDDFEKFGVFYRDIKDPYKAIIDPTGRCVIPWEVLTSDGYIFIGAYGVKDDITRTTEILKYKVKLGAITEDLKPSDPTPELWEQILARVADKVNVKQGAEHAGKVLGIDEEGNVAPVDSGSGAILDPTLSKANQAAEAKAVGEALAKKVDAAEGMGLSSNDYTDDDKLTVAQNKTDIENLGNDLNAFERNRPFNLTGNPVQVESFEGMPLNPVTVFAPKQAGSGNPSPTNIRPITGCDVLAISRVGKNLFLRENILDGLYIAAAQMTALSGTKSTFVKCKPNTTYTVSKIPGFTFRVAYTTEYPVAGVPIKNFTDNGNATSLTIRTGSDAQYLVAYVWLDGKGDDADAIFASLQIEEGNIATAYEAPGNTYTVQIGQTVYGGRFDWLTGKLTLEWEFVELGDNAQFYSANTMVYPNGERIRVTYVLPSLAQDSANEPQLVCNQLVNDYKIGGWGNGPIDNVWILAGYPDTLVMALPVSVYGTTENSIRAKFAETPMQVAYKLKTPTEIQLTPREILALSGTNTLYGDGEINISGRTDMQALVSNLLKRIATLESKANETE